MDEWWENDGPPDHMIRLDGQDVIQNINNQNQAITSVAVGDQSNWGGDTIWWYREWEAAGKCLGGSKHVKHLKLSDFFQTFGSASELRHFSHGLGLNRSIEAVQFIHNSEVQHAAGPDIIRCFENEMFQSLLLPFFKDNINIERLDFSLRGNTLAAMSVGAAIDACHCLKSISFSYSGSGNLEETIQAICNKSGLENLSIEGYQGFHRRLILLSRKSCLAIQNMLRGDDCSLKSLRLKMFKFSSEEDIELIASGLGENKSVKSLKISADEHEAKSLLGVLQNIPLNEIEQFQLYTACNVPDQNMCSRLAATLEQMPILQSLSIEGLGFDARSRFSTMVSPSSKLQKLTLSIDGFRDDDDSFQDLSLCLAGNKSLKVLQLLCNSFGLSVGLCTIFNSLQASEAELEELHLTLRDMSDSVIEALSQYVLSNQNMRKLSISVQRPVSLRWGPFALMLRTHTSIEEFKLCDETVRFSPQHRGNTVLVQALGMKSNLKRIGISLHSLDQLQIIANILEKPNCGLEELYIHYNVEGRESNALRRETAQLNQIIVAALRRNVSLKALQIQYKCGRDTWQSVELDWSPFSTLLCHKASIDAAAYHSNHTIQSILFECPGVSSAPIELYSMLHSNKGTNKHAVACEKILQIHKLASVDFSISFLPTVMSCVGNAESIKGLSQMYGILRKMPEVIHGSQKRRKL